MSEGMDPKAAHELARSCAIECPNCGTPSVLVVDSALRERGGHLNREVHMLYRLVGRMLLRGALRLLPLEDAAEGMAEGRLLVGTRSRTYGPPHRRAKGWKTIR